MILDVLLIAGATGASLIGAELLARIYLKRRDDWFVHAPARAIRVSGRPGGVPPASTHGEGCRQPRRRARQQAPQATRRSVPGARGRGERRRVLHAGSAAFVAGGDPGDPQRDRRPTPLAHVGNIACSLIRAGPSTACSSVLPRVRSPRRHRPHGRRERPRGLVREEGPARDRREPPRRCTCSARSTPPADSPGAPPARPSTACSEGSTPASCAPWIDGPTWAPLGSSTGRCAPGARTSSRRRPMPPPARGVPPPPDGPAPHLQEHSARC